MKDEFPKMTYTEKWFNELNRVCDAFHSTEYCSMSDGQINSAQGFYMVNWDNHKRAMQALGQEGLSKRAKKGVATMGKERLSAKAKLAAETARKSGILDRVHCPRCNVTVAKYRLPNHLKSERCEKFQALNKKRN